MYEIIDFIKEHLKKGHNVTAKMCAEHFGYEYHYFSKYFRKNMGSSFSNYMTAAKMELAISYVLSDMKISKVYENLHYQSSSSFSRGFKNQMGLSPAKFRDLTEQMSGIVQSILHSYDELQLFYDQDENTNDYDNALEVTCTFPPEANPKIVFVGIYHERLALGNPIKGIGVFNGNTCTIKNIPPGEYYILCSAFEPQSEFREMFLARKTLKACTKLPLNITENTRDSITLYLEKNPQDNLPAVINFPYLVATNPEIGTLINK